MLIQTAFRPSGTRKQMRWSRILSGTDECYVPTVCKKLICSAITTNAPSNGRLTAKGGETEGKQMSNWNMPPGTSTNDIPGNRANDDLEWQHETDHYYDPDPDCQMCRENWDYFGEAERIAEGRSNLMPTAAHIRACFARVEELSEQIEILKVQVSGLRRA